MITKRSAETGRQSTYWLLRVAIAGSILVAMGLIAFVFLIRTYSVPGGAMENSIMSGETIVVSKINPKPVRGTVLVFRYPGDRDVVVPESEQHYIKRCIAMAGDVVEVRDSRAIVNGVPEVSAPGLKIEDRPELGQAHLMTFPRGGGFGSQYWGPLRIPKKGDQLVLNDSTAEMWRVFIGREGHELTRNDGEIRIDGKPATSYIVERDYWFGLGDNRNNSEDSRFWGVIPYENTVGSPWIVLFSEYPGRMFAEVR